ncbi:MAG: hypothetical protein AAF266_02020 [Planctomycetota bacterium]
MKMRFAALAVAFVVSSVGCTAIQSGRSCGDVCGAGIGGGCAVPCRSMDGNVLPGRCNTGPGIFDKLGWTQRGCAECVDGCGGGCGLFGSGDPCCGGACGNGCGGGGCLQNALGMILDCNGCNSCGDQHYNFTPGPPVGQVAYPYYTTRGPRDFLMCNPPSIGPR